MNDERHARIPRLVWTMSPQVRFGTSEEAPCIGNTTVLQSRVPSYPLVPDKSQGDCSTDTRGENIIASDGPLAKQGPGYPFRASPKPHAEQKKESKRPTSVPKRVPKANLCQSSARIRQRH